MKKLLSFRKLLGFDSGAKSYWVGLRLVNGNWMWDDGELLSGQLTDIFKFDPVLGGSECIQSGSHAYFSVGPADCAAQLPFVCQTSASSESDPKQRMFAE